MRYLFMAAVSIFALTAGAVDVPTTERQEVRETIHGIEIVDPYRWLEGSASPELEGESPELDARVAEWTDAQNAYTREILDALPGREKLESRLRGLMEVGSITAPTMRRNSYFYWKREGNQAQRVLYVREGVNGDPRVLLDPNTLDEEGLLAPAFAVPSHDGELLAFGLYRAGDENSTLYVLEVESGTWLAEEIPLSTFWKSRAGPGWPKRSRARSAGSTGCLMERVSSTVASETSAIRTQSRSNTTRSAHITRRIPSFSSSTPRALSPPRGALLRRSAVTDAG
ncbi:MAG: hypothetical protein KY432_02405 [Acidobacteria bacterium]|nr:hypothetical protein [Acidobacteriota bacterium]